MRTSTVVGLTAIAFVGVGLHLLDTYSSEVLQILRGPRDVSAPNQAAAPPATVSAASDTRPVAPEGPPGAGADSAQPGFTNLSAPVIEALWPGSKVDQLAFGSRRYTDLTVVSITSETVTFRGEREIVSAPILSLPGELKDRAIAYLSESSRSIPTRTGSPAFPAQPRSTVGNSVPRARVTAVQPEDQVYLPEYAPSIAKRAAAERAERWLRFERPKDPMDILPLNIAIELEDPILVSESTGYWRVRGVGHVEARLASQSGSIRKTHKFEITVVVDAQGNVPLAEITLF